MAVMEGQENNYGNLISVCEVFNYFLGFHTLIWSSVVVSLVP